MVQRPSGIGIFEYVVLCGLRAVQLSRGCIPLVPAGDHKITTMARMEVSQLKIAREPLVATPVPALPDPPASQV